MNNAPSEVQTIPNRWFPEVSDASKLNIRGAVKSMCNHFKSDDPKAII